MSYFSKTYLMRNIIIMLIVSFIIVSCEKDHEPNKIIIKGTISGNTKLKSEVLTTTSSLSLSDAKKVLVFSKYYYELYDIVDGAFSVNGRLGTGVALIFLDDGNKYIGNLSNKGLNLLPLGNLSNGENTTIDLSTLTLVGTNVIPSHDPFGNEIIISEQEINSLQVVGEYFESLAKNIDTDNDGVADILTKTHLVATSIFGFTNCGYGGFNNKRPIVNNSSQLEITYSLAIAGGENIILHDNITLSGPVGDPYSDINSYPFVKNRFDGSYGFLASFFRATENNAFVPFKKGTYTLTIDNIKSYTLNYSNMDAFYGMVLVIPSIQTNSSGKLTSISLEYKFPDGREIINPANLLTNVMAQVCNK